MIIPQHIAYFDEIFSMDGFLTDPILTFGYQEILRPERRWPFQSKIFDHPDLSSWLRAHGHRDISTLDLFDDRSELRYDMNEPVPESEHERYATLIDVGCLEHVWDTKVCLENCMRMLKVGGHLLLHTCVNGYYSHGLHVFNPEGLLTALELNGFDLRYVKFCRLDGTQVRDPGGLQDVIIWAVARKTRSLVKFVCPQQGKWSTRYRAAKELL